MYKVGITGQSGFVGTHLFNTLGLYPQKFKQIPFEDSFFENKTQLREFVQQCDVIVHLAAMNRHNDPDVLYSTNIGLVKQLIDTCEKAKVTPHILFSSSTQEERDNLYGKSKKEGRLLLEEWAEKNLARFTGLVIPNVFGPFGNPYYNSVVATFCHQLTHQEEPKIENDSEINLIYVAELVQHILNKIEEIPSPSEKGKILPFETVWIPATSAIKVSALLSKLVSMKKNYFDNGILPDLSHTFDLQLFNTFLCYIDHSTFFPFQLKLNTDDRGSFVEMVKLNSGGQVSFSTTVPGITRGNHFHTRKAERFTVIKGRAKIELRRIGSDRILTFELDGNEPSFVDMPIWFTHNITNVGEEELYTVFWINESFNTNDPDTYFEKV